MADVTDDARLLVDVRPASGHESLPTITLLGTRDGLEWLAGRLLAVARNEPDGWSHLDEEVYGPVLQTGGWRLTVARHEGARGVPPG